MYQYLIVFEDGSIMKAVDIKKEDWASCEAGYMDIIRLSDLTTYILGEWQPIEQLSY